MQAGGGLSGGSSGPTSKRSFRRFFNHRFSLDLERDHCENRLRFNRIAFDEILRWEIWLALSDGLSAPPGLRAGHCSAKFVGPRASPCRDLEDISPNSAYVYLGKAIEELLETGDS